MHSQWTLKGIGPDGSAVEMEMQGTEIVRKQADGSWKFIIDNPYSAG
jgi:ketosteroid isomerase-like protein